MRALSPVNSILCAALIACALVALVTCEASAQAPAYPDSVSHTVQPLTFDGTGTSAWGPISATADSTALRPVDPSMSAWEYPVAGLWWLIKLPFALINHGFKALVYWRGDIPFFDTIERLLSRVPDFGLKAKAEWTPTSGFRYGAQLYENRPFDGNLHLQYTFVAGGRDDLVNTVGTRTFLGSSTWLDFVGSYHRRGAERFNGIGPGSSADDESFFAGRYTWTGASLRQQFDHGLAAEARVLYSDVRNAGPRQLDRFDSTEDLFASDLPHGWSERSTGMSYEFEFMRDVTGTRGRGVRGGLQRAMVSYFQPTSGPGEEFLHYRLALEQFIGGSSPAGRQLALKFSWSWMDGSDEVIHFQRLITNHGADSFRGYHGFRFRDRGIIGGTAEYRYPVWDYGQVGGGLGADGYVFYDTGQVFSGHSNVRMRALTHSLGLGIRLVNADDFMARVEVAGSRENFLFRFSVSQIFQHAKGGVFDGRVPIPMR
ncbi:hypothetical protein DRQ53_07770 [bacterium]|nr:MAG: hypothetical protein DRQ32_02335 [bacterium]RKZ15901.1 MAG: hypothetical protein DRQ53_07770 [bacterium]